MSNEIKFCQYVLYNVNSPGGHIGIEDKGSLCGIEKRFPDLETEQGHAEFNRWFQLNELFICKLCVKKYKRMTCEKKQ